MQNIITICTLGKFSITYQNKTFAQNNTANKMWQLLAYLIINNHNNITQETLINLLWQNEKSKNPANALKILIYRTNIILKQNLSLPDNLLLHSHDNYSINPNYTVNTDYAQFNQYITQLNQAISQNNFYNTQQLYTQLLTIYKGDFLTKFSHLHWIMPLNSYYHSLFVKTAINYLQYLNTSSNYYLVIEKSQYILNLEPYNEKIYTQLLIALLNTHQYKKANQIYANFNNLLQKDLSITTSISLQHLYQTNQSKIC